MVEFGFLRHLPQPYQKEMFCLVLVFVLSSGSFPICTITRQINSELDWLLSSKELKGQIKGNHVV